MPKILFAGVSENNALFPEKLVNKGYDVTIASDIQQSIENLNNVTFDVVITGFALQVDERDSIIDILSENHPKTRCIVYAEEPSIQDSVALLKQGVFDYIPSPAKEDEFFNSLNKAVGINGQGNGSAGKEQSDQPGIPFTFYDFVGESDAVMKITSIVKRVASTDSTVLVTGESGTGKELIARAIHKNSPRRDSAMITINCGSIPGELLESELFGHEKGAFTGAHRARAGRFELADGGTIFLDEIGDMSPDLQVKLLRVLQEQCFERVGGTKSIHVDVRIISATNKELKKAIDENTFREDLFYRLNVIPIQVPPLRRRKSDIPLLIEHFIKKLHEKNRWGIKKFSDEAMAALCAYDWTGNVRELENLMERISVLVESDTVHITDLPDYIADSGSSAEAILRLTECLDDGRGFNEAVEEHQKQLILHALNKTNWVKAKAAELLKMKRTTLVEKIKKMNLEPVQDTDSE